MLSSGVEPLTWGIEVLLICHQTKLYFSWKVGGNIYVKYL